MRLIPGAKPPKGYNAAGEYIGPPRNASSPLTGKPLGKTKQGKPQGKKPQPGSPPKDRLSASKLSKGAEKYKAAGSSQHTGSVKPEFRNVGSIAEQRIKKLKEKGAAFMEKVNKAGRGRPTSELRAEEARLNRNAEAANRAIKASPSGEVRYMLERQRQIKAQKEIKGKGSILGRREL